MDAATFVRDLLRTGRHPSRDELSAILAELARAPFSTHEKRVPVKYRGHYQGYRIGARAPSHIAHLIQRVREEQWRGGTTIDEYLTDLRAVASARSVRLVIYTDYRGVIVGMLAPTVEAVPPARHGAQALPWIYVIYAADQQVIVSGYMVSAPETTWQGADARWLM